MTEPTLFQTSNEQEFRNNLGDWRSTNVNLRAKFEYAYDNSLFTDLIIVVGPEREKFQAHSIILNLQSPMFEKKYGTFNIKEGMEIEMPKFDPKYFRIFLKYLYTEQEHLIASAESAISVLYIAKQFEITRLVGICSKFLKKEINPENATIFFSKAYEYDEGELKEFAVKYILENAEAVFKSDGFLGLNSECLSHLLEYPGRKIDELGLFKVLLNWGKQECERESLSLNGKNLRTVAYKVIKLVNFGQIHIKDIKQFVAGEDILTSDELVTIYNEAISREFGSEESLDIGQNQSNKRSSTTSNVNKIMNSSTLKRYKAICDKTWKECKSFEKITFKANRGIQIISIGLYGYSGGSTEPSKTMLKITNFEETVTLDEQIANSRLPEKPGIFQVKFYTPVKLVENVWYTLHVLMEGEMRPYGTGGQKRYDVNLDSNEAVTFDFKNSKGISGYTLASGQFPEIIFSL